MKVVLARATFCSIFSDETTDISTIFRFRVHFRCVSSRGVSARFGGLVAAEKRDAETIEPALKDKCLKVYANWQKYHLGRNGASVFTRRHNSLEIITQTTALQLALPLRSAGCSRCCQGFSQPQRLAGSHQCSCVSPISQLFGHRSRSPRLS